MSKKPETAAEWAESIPEDMRKSAWHELGKMLGHGGAGTVHTDDGGNNGPPPTGGGGGQNPHG